MILEYTNEFSGMEAAGLWENILRLWVHTVLAYKREKQNGSLHSEHRYQLSSLENLTDSFINISMIFVATCSA